MLKSTRNSIQKRPSFPKRHSQGRNQTLEKVKYKMSIDSGMDESLNTRFIGTMLEILIHGCYYLKQGPP